MTTFARTWCGLVAALCLGFAPPAWSQRISFPSRVSGTFVQNPTPATNPTPLYGSGPAPIAPAPAAPAAAPAYGGVPSFGSPPPSYGTAPPSYPAQLPATAAQPPASFQGTVAPAQTWDPYANPGANVPGASPYSEAPPPAYAQPPSSLYPEGTPAPFTPGGYGYPGPDAVQQPLQRLFQEIRFEYTWLAGDGAGAFDINTVELSATAVFPFFYNAAPVLITPGFATHFLEGPQSPADLPPRVYDAYVDTAWRPELTPWLAADLAVRMGLYTDFQNVSADSIRIMGRGLGVLTFSPTLKLALGVVYLDRIPVKLLPAGGVIWTPNEDTRFEILFPRPKLATRLTTVGTTEFWWYIAAEYGGGKWTVSRVGGDDEVGYNDYRVMGGIEWRNLSGVRGAFEAGYVFNREVIFTQLPPPSFAPDPTFMLRAGIAY